MTFDLSLSAFPPPEYHFAHVPRTHHRRRGVGSVVVHKCARRPGVFTDICLASRTESKCKAVAAQLDRPIRTAQVDADHPDRVAALIRDFRPQLVINVALPYQDLCIMDAMLMLDGRWWGDGVFNIEQLDPDPFIEAIGRYGLPWQITPWNDSI